MGRRPASKAQALPDWWARVMLTKLAPPRSALIGLDRPKLRGRIGAKRLTILQAPSGYGKTMMMEAAWTALRSAGAATAWMSFETADAGLEQASIYFVASLAQAGLLTPSVVAGAYRDPPSLGQAQDAAVVINCLAAQDRPVQIFIDDYHVVGDGDFAGAMRTLIMSAPDNVCFVIGTRSQVVLPTALLRANGQLEEIDVNALRFDEEEVAALSALHGAGPLRHDLAIAAEGWPLATRLAVLAQAGDVRRPRQEKVRTTREAIFGDLLDDLFGRLDPALQSFLALTAIPDRISVDLATALTERTDAADVIRGLATMGFPISRFEADVGSFRYHSLLLLHLRTRLKAESPDRFRAAHERAAQWFAEQGLYHEVIYHVCAVDGSSMRALEMLEDQGGWRALHYHGLPALGALSSLPEASIDMFPLTALGQILAKAAGADHVEARSRFQRWNGRTGAGRRADTLQADRWSVDTLLRCYEDDSFTVEELERSSADIDRDINPPHLRVLAKNLTVVGLSMIGESRLALDRSALLSVENRSLGMTYAEHYMELYRGLALARLGQVDDADTLFQRLSDDACTNFGSGSNLAKHGAILGAWTALIAGDPHRSSAILAPILPQLDAIEGTCDVLLAALETDFALGLGKAGDEVFATCERALHIAKRRQWDRLRLVASCWLVRAELVRGTLGKHCAPFEASAPEAAGHWYSRDALAVTLAQIAIERGDFASACTAIEPLMLRHDGLGHELYMSQYRLLTAIALTGLGESGAAARSFARVHPSHIARDGLIFRQLPLRARTLLRSWQPGLFEVAPGREVGERMTSLMTGREREVLRGLIDGLCNKEIGASLSISEDTVKFHRRNVYRKLGANNRSKIVAIARREGLA